MKAEDLLGDNKELAHKRRPVSDLIRHIATTTGDSPNYSILLGAGCSVTSGISPATELIKHWTLELYERFSENKESTFEMAQEYLVKNQGSWYNPLNPYASLFEKKYDFAMQRRRFVENEVDGKLPSIGYAYLCSLANKNYFNTLFTTNFDDLINEAFYQYSNIRPQQCAHDSSIASISITSKRPKIIKLHGDYLFDDIKSTLRETESLEQNTKEKLIEFCKEYGLIVIGYSGNDRSIMDVLEFLTKQDNYLKNGIYWCLRKGDEVSHTLRNLLWKDKVHPVLIEGFDEFFAETYASIIKNPLDLKSNTKESKLKIAINYIIDDNYNLKKNSIIKNEIEFIKRNENSNDISEFINDLSKENESDDELSLADMRNLMEVESLIEKGKLKEALKQCEDLFSSIEDSDYNRKPAYLRKLITISKYMDDMPKAKRWCDILIAIDSNNINSYLLKSSSIESLTERRDFLKEISQKFPNKYVIHNALADACESLIKNKPSNTLTSMQEQVSHLEKSIKLEPSLDNPAWIDLFNALQAQKKFTKKQDKNKDISEKIDALLKNIRTCNQNHITTLKIEANYALTKNSQEILTKTISNLYEKHNNSSRKEKNDIVFIINKIITNSEVFEDPVEYKKLAIKFYEETIKDKEIKKISKLLIGKAAYFIGLKKDYAAAKNYLNNALDCKGVTKNIIDAIELASIVDPDLLNKITSIIEKQKHTLTPSYYHRIKSIISENQKNMSLADHHIERAFHYGLPLEVYLANKTYNLLIEEKYNDVIKLMDHYLPGSDMDDYETSIINYSYAAKKIGSEKYNKTKLLNLSAQSTSNDVKICAFIMCDNEIAAKRLIQHETEKSFMHYIKFSKWPIIEKKLLEFTELDSLEKIA